MVREAVDPSKDRTTPLKNDAKKYWNYGYALGIFEKPAEDTFIENVYKTSNFLSVFPETMFIKNSKIKKTLSENMSKDMGIDFVTIPEGSLFTEEFKKEVEKDYARLSKLTNENINTRVRMYNHEVQPAVPPLTLAIYHADNWSDARFLSLIKNWLGLGDGHGFDNINVNSVSDKGTTPLQASLQAYKKSKNSKEKDFAQDFKLISLAIIERSSIESFTVKSVKTRREALQEAIESYDLDLVKAIIEKGLDVNGLLISADDVSPVYYCIQWIIQAKFPDKFFKQLFTYPESINMVWENLNMPGLTNSDKKKLYEEYGKEISNNDDLKKIMPEFIHVLHSIPKDEEHIANLRSICLYLIEKTCSFQIVDRDCCRALLKNGANPNLHLGFAPEWGYITFLKRCISFEAWEVLEMFLSEFPELAKVTINESDNMYGLSSLTAFLRKMIETREHTPGKYRGRDFVINMANLFGKCGASYNQPSMFGSANDMLKCI